MKQYKIGDTRTFEKYLGKWKIVDVIKDKNISFELVLKSRKCPYCGGSFGDKMKYVFNYIEILKEGKRKMYLGISDCERYVLLNEYLNEEIIENAIQKN